jgi:hypothetical protein
MPPESNQPQGNYDFILSDPQVPKRKLFNSSKPSTSKILIIAGGSVVLIVLIVIISSLFLGKGNDSASLVTLAEQQNELVRVSTKGVPDVAQQSTKNLATNIEFTLTSDQKQLLSYLSSIHTKVNPKSLLLKENLLTDKQLTNAVAIDTIDTVFIQIMQTQLTSYQQSLKQVYDKSSKTSEKQILNNAYSNAKLLLAECTSAAGSLSST